MSNKPLILDMSQDSNEISEFQKAIWKNPIVNNGMHKFLWSDGSDLVTTLKEIIVMLVKQNDELTAKLQEMYQRYGNQED